MAHPKRHALTAQAPRADVPEKYKGINLRPPEGARSEAKRGLAWREEHGRGGTEIGVARARDIANGRRLSPETVRRMKAYFDRHEADKKGKGWARGEDGYPSAGRIAWALWGGDAGRSWASKVIRQLDAADARAVHALAARLRGRPMSLRRDTYRASAYGEAFALDARLFGDLARPRAAELVFDVPQPVTAQADRDSGICVIDVCGPLEHHASWWHSYDEIVRQVEEAAACAEVRAIVLRFDSPGGVVSGCFEAHAAIRRARKRSGKPVLAWVDEMACSAAYELAAACDEIWGPASMQVGSIGVILGAWDTTKALTKAGIEARYWTTGARKADMHPGTPIDEAVSKAAQHRVDDLGAIFFRDVARGRALALPLPKDVGSAAVFLGSAATAAGLADQVASWPAFVAHVAQLAATVGSERATGTRARDNAGASRMKTTLIKERDEAAAAVASAKTDAARKSATARYMAALTALAGLGGETAGRMVEEKKTTVERYEEEGEDEKEDEHAEEEESAEDEKEDEEAEDEGEEEEAQDSATDAPEAEDDADEKALRAAYRAGTKHLHSATGSNGTAADVYSPSNLLRVCRAVVAKATGKDASRMSIKGVFGALDALGQRVKAADKLGAKVEKLEQDSRAVKVEKALAEGRKAGKVGGKEHAASLRADGMKHGAAWLKAHLAAAPKVVRTREEGTFVPREGADGAGSGNVGLMGFGFGAEQAKIIETMTASMTPEGKAQFMATLADNMKTASNGKARPAH